MESVKIIIYGTGHLISRIVNSLDDHVEILVCVDDFRQGEPFENFQVQSPDIIKSFDFDLVVFSNLNPEPIRKRLSQLGISQDKCLDLTSYIYEKEVQYLKRTFFDQPAEYDFFITGSSYFQHAFLPEDFSQSIANLALASQDLFSDFLMADRFLASSHAEIAVIGLMYYAFDFDLSYTKHSHILYRYCQLSDRWYRQLKHKDRLIKNQEKIRPVLEKLFKDSCGRRFNHDRGFEHMSDMNAATGKVWAEKQSQKDYPETRRQTFEIFMDYLDKLYEQKVKPIVVVPPVHQYYSAHFKPAKINGFYDLMAEAKKKHTFEIHDYFKSDAFSDQDFYEPSHLNRKGAKRFQKIIAEDLFG